MTIYDGEGTEGARDGADDVVTADGAVIRGFDVSGTELSAATEYVADEDGFAAGYVDGDGKADFVIANDPIFPLEQSTIRVVSASGAQLGSFITVFESGDALALGDAIDQVRVLDSTGAEIRTFSVAFSDPDGFSAGDVDGDGIDEVVVVDEDTNTIDVHEALGVLVSSFGADAVPGYRLAVGAFGDGDGIPDRVERLGIRRGDGSMAMDLPALGASPCRKTIPVEMDYMSGNGHSHMPEPEAVAEMQAAYTVAPVPGTQPCPYSGVASVDGVDLVVVVDDPVPEGPLDTAAKFDAIKSANFDPVL